MARSEPLLWRVLHLAQCHSPGQVIVLQGFEIPLDLAIVHLRFNKGVLGSLENKSKILVVIIGIAELIHELLSLGLSIVQLLFKVDGFVFLVLEGRIGRAIVGVLGPHGLRLEFGTPSAEVFHLSARCTSAVAILCLAGTMARLVAAEADSRIPGTTAVYVSHRLGVYASLAARTQLAFSLRPESAHHGGFCLWRCSAFSVARCRRPSR